MATAGTRDSRNFWASVGMGLIAGLLIVLLIFRLTSPGDVAATTSADAATTAGDQSAASSNDTGGSATVTATAVTSPPTNPATPAEPTSASSTTATGDATAASSAAGEPTVKVTRSIGPCKSGDECLWASFTISGFPDQPNKFVCEFQDGSQFSYSFKETTVEQACYTSTKPGSITILVNDVRSETITNP